MTLSQKLVSLISDSSKFVCITGAGGKTTLMQLLAQEYKRLGKSVLMTTTTKVQSPLHYAWKADYIFTSRTELETCEIKEPCVVLYAEPNENPEKLQSPGEDILEQVKERFDVVLCEADGNRQMPIKVHTDRDPVVPNFATYTICMMGAWGKVENLQEYIDSPQGLLKGSIVGKRVALINEAIVFPDIQWPEDCDILIASVKDNELFGNC